MADFDAIVCGSGITGGWAAKELTERGLKVLMIERGPNLEHRTDYKTEYTPVWELPFRGEMDPKVLATTKRIQKYARMNEWVQDMFVDDDIDVYQTPAESAFRWMRGYHLGGRSVMWGRHCYRMSETHLGANAKDGHGVPWPVRYQDIAPWYDHVEKFIGVNGTVDNLPSLPDGIYQPSMGLNAGEQRLADVVKAHYEDRRLIPGRTANLTQPIGDRSPCQYRNQCARGCSFGAYFSTQSSTLPAAQATGRLTLWTDMIVESIDYDPATKRATAVKLYNTKTGQHSSQAARLIFVCTGSINSVALLLRSASDAAPGGLGNSSGLLGKYLMDHLFTTPTAATISGIDDQFYRGRKPNGIVMPRFVNMGRDETDFLRGYSYQGGCGRSVWNKGGKQAGIGADFKNELRLPGPWTIGLGASIECIPRRENTISIDPKTRDKYGLPVVRLDLRWSDNEKKAAAHAKREARTMLALLGGQLLSEGGELQPGGMSIHEMGGACMGADPRASVTNAHNQLHDAQNVFVTDGAFMCSTGDRNPSLTYMAFTARAAAHAVELVKQGSL
ncbi:MAG: GMC family oxidoreductase [Steroidobacteraceae bacterium]